MVQTTTFHRFINRKQVGLFVLHGAAGMSATITNYGAKIVSLVVPNAEGVKKDVVLGFNTLDEWMTQETYFNAVIGRYANRIKDGRFHLDGKEYQLPVNNGTNSLHGGVSGFNEKVWDVVAQDNHSVTLHYRSADNEENYPGTLDVYVTYQLTRDSGLSITYEAKTDRPTIVGFTQHAYFNLNGEGNGDIRNHVLTVFADQYTPFDDTFCPTGEIISVENTPMDFLTPVCIGDRIDDPFFAPGKGIDNNWVLNKERIHALSLAAICEADGTKMEVWTTMPGLQVYTGNWVERHIGKSGQEYDVQTAICLEAQNFPDSPNHDNFPSPVLRPGETYREQTIYKFVK